MQDHEMKAKVVIDYIKQKKGKDVKIDMQQFLYDPSASVLLDIAYEYAVANPISK